MTPAHESLCFRKKSNPRLKRPTVDHPKLGHLEYVNRDGGCWQSMILIDGCEVRLDIEAGSKLAAQDLEKATEHLDWVINNQTHLLSFVRTALQTNAYRTNLVDNADGSNGPKLPENDSLDLLELSMILLFGTLTEVRYDCSRLPGRQLFDCNTVSVSIDETTGAKSLFLSQDELDRRAAAILERSIPAEAPQFLNSLADQFLARLAEWGSFKFDDQLHALLCQAIADVSTSAGNSSYLGSVHNLLLDIQDESERDKR